MCVNFQKFLKDGLMDKALQLSSDNFVWVKVELQFSLSTGSHRQLCSDSPYYLAYLAVTARIAEFKL
jgi:hypothetical protein